MDNILNRTDEPNALLIIYNDCIGDLQTGPIIIGENHGCTHGRALALDLFEQGHVQRFFFEYPNFPMRSLRRQGHNLLMPEYYRFNDYLGGLSGSNYRTDQFWGEFLSYISINISGEIELIEKRELVEEALNNNIKITFYEDCNLWGKTGGQDFILRNQKAAEMFNALPTQERKKTLVLCGASHTTVRGSIQRLMGIEESRVKNMSRFAK